MFYSSKKSFSVLEIITVVVIIGIIAGFAIPNFNTAIEKGRYRNARLNVIAIHSALKIYHAKNGTYLPVAATLTDVNTNLEINVTDNEFTYAYVADTDTFTITATRNDLDYAVSADQNTVSSANPSCSGADCPN